MPFIVFRTNQKKKKDKLQVTKVTSVTSPWNSTEDASSKAGGNSVQNEILYITFAYIKRE